MIDSTSNYSSGGEERAESAPKRARLEGSGPVPLAPRPSLSCEVTLPIKRYWFEQINYGEKTVEFREASSYWRKKLVGRPGLRVRLCNGRGPSAPYSVHEARSVEILPTDQMPEGLAPPPGTPAFAELFGSATVVIAIRLGPRLELSDAKRGSDAAVAVGPAPRRSQSANAAPKPPDRNASPPQCAKCGAVCEVRTAGATSKNPGRQFYKCASHSDQWVGWADDAPKAKAKGGRANGGVAGHSFSELLSAEQAQQTGCAERARDRNDGGSRGRVVGFDRFKRVVSNEQARKDPSAPVTANMLREARRRTDAHEPLARCDTRADESTDEARPRPPRATSPTAMRAARLKCLGA